MPGIIELNAGTGGATSALVSGRGKHALDRDVFIDTFPTQSRAADLQPYLGQFRLTGLP